MREDVLADVVRRNIRFPDFADIQVPIRSTFTGEILDHRISSGSLVVLVVDMLLIQPVNWDLVVNSLLKATPRDVSVRLVNFGPGMGIARGMEKIFPRGRVSSLDVAVTGSTSSLPKQESIAIVGMAVNLPGAPNISRFWDILERGINMISEVTMHSPSLQTWSNCI